MEKDFSKIATENMFTATKYCNNKSLQRALKNGADPNKVHELGNTPLELARRLQDFGAFRILLENGADPNKINNFGQNPLEIAIDRLDLRAVSLLLEYGADPQVFGS